MAIIDSEMDVNHPDLEGAFYRDENGHAKGFNARENHVDVRPINQRIQKPRDGIEDLDQLIADRDETKKKKKANFSRSISHATHVGGQ